MEASFSADQDSWQHFHNSIKIQKRIDISVIILEKLRLLLLKLRLLRQAKMTMITPII